MVFSNAITLVTFKCLIEIDHYTGSRSVVRSAIRPVSVSHSLLQSLFRFFHVTAELHSYHCTRLNSRVIMSVMNIIVPGSRGNTDDCRGVIPDFIKTSKNRGLSLLRNDFLSFRIAYKSREFR